jgi:hypothetical protein
VIVSPLKCTTDQPCPIRTIMAATKRKPVRAGTWIAFIKDPSVGCRNYTMSKALLRSLGNRWLRSKGHYCKAAAPSTSIFFAIGSGTRNVPPLRIYSAFRLMIGSA